MKASVEISRGIESLFGTRDENIRLLEDNLGIVTRLHDGCLEIEGEEASVARAESILADYVALIAGRPHVFQRRSEQLLAGRHTRP